MRVSADSHVHRAYRQLLAKVSHRKVQTFVLKEVVRIYLRAVITIVVVVTQHRLDGRNGTQVCPISLGGNVSCMDNQVRALKRV